MPAVDFARLLLADESNPGKWMHNDSIDGKADFVFWGLNAPELAAAIHAPAIGDDEFGWTDIPVNESEQRYEAAEALKAERGWRLATDLRPHSHHWQALALARAAPTESSTIDVDDLRVCLFFTSWGDGSFPVYIDLDAAGKPAQIRIQLQTEDSIAAMESVNK